MEPLSILGITVIYMSPPPHQIIRCTYSAEEETALKKGFLQTLTEEILQGIPLHTSSPNTEDHTLEAEGFNHQPPLGTTLQCLGQDLDRILTDSK